MAKVNLVDITRETFGARFPNVFIEEILVDYHTATDTTNSAKISAKLNIKFTKPAHLQHKSVEEFINSYLSDLYLYVYLPYNLSVKTKLENGNFNMLEWMKYEADSYPSSYRDENNKKISLVKLIENHTATVAEMAGTADVIDVVGDRASEYGSRLITNNSFDSFGNEIIEISNISLEFTAGNAYGAPKISDVPSVLLMAAVGFHAAPLRNARFDDFSAFPYTSDIEFDDSSAAYSETYMNHPQLFNRNFGNITYYHILTNGEVTPRFYQIYTTPDGAPYYGDVLQSLNGKFYATGGFSFDSIKRRFEALIAEYGELRQLDATLNRNINDLEAIINATRNKTNVLGEIANYRSTYPNKEQTTNSGRFYSELMVVFSEILESVHTQTELSNKMFFDSLVIDKRTSLLGEAWVKPDQPFQETSGDFYLSKNWFNMNANAFLMPKSVDITKVKEIYGSDTINLSALAGLEGHDTGESVDVAPYVRGAGSDPLKADYGAFYDGLVEQYRDQGFSKSQAQSLAAEELDYIFSGGGDEDTTLVTNLLNPTKNDTDMLEFFEGNIIVKYRGFFFFDYEKALRCTSEISKLVYIEKLQKYFRINIPYSYFYYDRVKMSRRELQLDIDGTTGGEDGTWVQPNITSFFVTPGTDGVDYPKVYDGKYDFTTSLHTREADDIQSNSRFKYGRPTVFQDSTGDSYLSSFLKPKNWDVPTADVSRRLEGFNSLDSVSSWDNLNAAEGTQTVIDGYRLQCFEFLDFVDDDIAYYNNTAATTHGEVSGRLENIKSLNNFDHPGTVYRLEVKLGDTTTNAYCNFVNQVLNAYNDYLDYVAEARQICSYNNITNSYNQFFIDKINERYDHKPWVRAAYYAVGVSDMLFGAAGAISEEAYREAVIREVMKIAPETGNLTQTIEFARVFNTLLQYIGGIEPIDGATLAPTEADSTPARSFDSTAAIFKTYKNQVPITTDIYGDIAPDLLGDDEIFSVRDVVPTPVAKTTFSYSLPFVDRSGDYDNIFNDISDSEKVRLIWERVFLRLRGSSMFTILFPQDGEPYYYDIYDPDGDGMGTHVGGELIMERFRSRIDLQMRDKPKYWSADADGYVTTTDDGEESFTGLNYIIHKVMRNFTTDIEMHDSNTKARRKSSGEHAGGSMAGMRNYRTIHQVLHVFKTYIRPETQRRVNTLGLAPEAYYSDSGVRDYLMSAKATSGAPTFYDLHIQFSLIPRLVLDAVDYIITYIENRLAGSGYAMGATAAGGFDASDFFDYDLADDDATIGYDGERESAGTLWTDPCLLLGVVREENPWGSDNFNTSY